MRSIDKYLARDANYLWDSDSAGVIPPRSAEIVRSDRQLVRLGERVFRGSWVGQSPNRKSECAVDAEGQQTLRSSS